MITKSFILLIACVVSFSLSFYAIRQINSYIEHWNRSYLNCDTKFVIVDGENVLSIAMSYFFSGNEGLLVYKGRFTFRDKSYNVSRNIAFKVLKWKDLIRVESTSTGKTPVDNTPDNILDEILPSFYVRNNATMEFRIYSIAQDGYVFSTGYVPSFYCLKPTTVAN